MLTTDAATLAGRAARLATMMPVEADARTRAGESAVGGGSFPGASLPSTLVALDPGEFGAHGLALRLRLGEPPVIARVESERVLLDPRTIPPDLFDTLAAAVTAAFER
jgi:L-seryl-tRNA(Ser) seleniumtransferase